MTSTSPFLDQLLIQWAEQASQVRKEAVFQKSIVEPLVLATHGNYIAKDERRRRDLRQLEQLIQDAETRWDERLRRVEEWKVKVLHIQSQQIRFGAMLGASVWLKKAREHHEAFLQHLKKGSDRLEITYQVLHNKLAEWLGVLNEREQGVYELVSKAQQSQGPFYVSRARKQPEVDFINEQIAAQTSLGQELQAARHSLNHLRSRLKKAQVVVEERAAGAEIFYEIHKQEIIAAMKSMEAVLDQRREEILSEALVYESGRHLLHKLNGVIQRLSCLEDIPQPKRGFFKR